MPSQRADEILLLRYLLGNLSESEEAEIEDRAFADSEYLGALEAVEADLIDTWVAGGLSESERRAFEQRFLVSPGRRSKVEFARALARIAADRPAPAPKPVGAPWRIWIPALSFAALLCIAVVWWQWRPP